MSEKLIRYRFSTRSVEDYRPLIDMKPMKMPWWCSGCAGDDSFVTIVCYLPKGDDLFKYWDDAFDIEKEEVSEITYTSRFAKPKWLD